MHFYTNDISIHKILGPYITIRYLTVIQASILGTKPISIGITIQAAGIDTISLSVFIIVTTCIPVIECIWKVNRALFLWISY